MGDGGKFGGEKEDCKGQCDVCNVNVQYMNIWNTELVEINCYTRGPK